MSLLKKGLFQYGIHFPTIDFQGTFVSFQSSGSDPLDEKEFDGKILLHTNLVLLERVWTGIRWSLPMLKKKHLFPHSGGFGNETPAKVHGAPLVLVSFMGLAHLDEMESSYCSIMCHWVSSIHFRRWGLTTTSYKEGNTTSSSSCMASEAYWRAIGSLCTAASTTSWDCSFWTYTINENPLKTNKVRNYRLVGHIFRYKA